MARIKMHIPKAKLPFYPPCEVKCRLQNGVSTELSFFTWKPSSFNSISMFCPHQFLVNRVHWTRIVRNEISLKRWLTYNIVWVLQLFFLKSRSRQVNFQQNLPISPFFTQKELSFLLTNGPFFFHRTSQKIREFHLKFFQVSTVSPGQQGSGKGLTKNLKLEVSG